MLSLNISSNAAETLRRLSVQRQQVPFATAVALTRTAVAVKEAEYREMRDVFDRPTPYTLDSLYTKGATKGDLTARVWLKYDTSKGTPADKYLLPQIRGGGRSMKRFELALRGVGAMPSGYYAVPGSAAKLDAYGNMDRGQIVQILSYFRAFPEVGYKANITEKRKRRLGNQGIAYFAGAPGDGKLPPGIWMRRTFGSGSAIKPVVIFVKSVLYSQRFDFDYVGQQTVKKEFPGQFERAIAEANAGAR